jgi:tape measure domain-containing protein
MPSLGKLSVEIAADIKGLQKGIREAESVMARSAKSLGALSANLSQSITLPLLGIGIGAVKAAADLNKLTDGLKTTMLDAGRSIFSVNNEVEALRKAALAPGLDFDQAVKGSLRLQGVGRSAESAREILVQFGNAIAVAGGSSAQLDSVTTQLSQIIGKGKILNEDLAILKENMPSISKAMVEAFGTADAEGLRKLGISTDEFVTRLTKQLSTLPRATGGLANGITNAFSAIKQGAADLGNVIATKLNLAERLDQFATAVLGMADSFKALSPTTQSVALGIGLFAAGIGPAIKLGSLLVSGVIGIRNAMLSMRAAQLAIQETSLISWFQSLNTVMKANIIGATVGVLVAAYVAFQALNAEVSTATKIQQSLTAIEKEATASVSEERVKTGLLIDTLKSETATREQKADALKKLQAISPAYFKDLSVEKLSIDQLNLAYDGYINSILRAARAKAAESKLIELDKQALEIAEKRNNAAAQAAAFVVPDRPRRANTSGVGDLQDDAARAASLAQQAKANSDIQIKAFDDQAAAVKQQMDALKGLIQVNTDLVPPVNKAATATVQSTAAIKEASKAANVYKEALSDVQKEIDRAALTGADAFSAQADAIEGGINKLLDAGFAKGSAEVQKFVDMMAALKASVATTGPLTPLAQGTVAAPVSTAAPDTTALTEGLTVATTAMTTYKSTAEQLGEVNMNLQTGMIGFAQASKETADIIAASNMKVQQVVDGAKQAMDQYAASGGTSFAEMGKAALAGAAKVVRSFIMQGVAAAAAKALTSMPFPINIALAAGAGAAAGVLFNKLISAVGIPALADGGIASGPTMAMVGEYAGARGNPEVIAPLDKLQGMMGGGNRVEVGGTFRIEGTDLVVVLEKAQKNYQRVRGYP